MPSVIPRPKIFIYGIFKDWNTGIEIFTFAGKAINEG